MDGVQARLDRAIMEARYVLYGRLSHREWNRWIDRYAALVALWARLETLCRIRDVMQNLHCAIINAEIERLTAEAERLLGREDA